LYLQTTSFKDIILKHHGKAVTESKRDAEELGLPYEGNVEAEKKISEADFICAALRATQAVDAETLELIRGCFKFVDGCTGRKGHLNSEVRATAIRDDTDLSADCDSC
jgi:hypothetical protein